ncbi:hypothetical protein PIB30_068894 [Stylosanthes scabra]|uniref:Uncharacterized protein n=1 Tax=Stylosanthes scabra TaxID=79078 RepID=A0ABU6SNE8_9FABA|nr:hypothetical protein [Stylosanthes scabra]
MMNHARQSSVVVVSPYAVAPFSGTGCRWADDVPDWLCIYDCLFTKLIAPKNADMGDSGSGFLSSQVHGKMKIFDILEESFHRFKEMYFKIFGTLKTQPFFLTLEKKPRFDLYACIIAHRGLTPKSFRRMRGK